MHELRMHAGLNALRPSSRTVEPKVRYLLGPVYVRPGRSQTEIKACVHETSAKITNFSMYSPCPPFSFFQCFFEHALFRSL
jgi:hypothetical protein